MSPLARLSRPCLTRRGLPADHSQATTPVPATPRVTRERPHHPPPPLLASLGPLLRANPPQGNLEASTPLQEKEGGRVSAEPHRECPHFACPKTCHSDPGLEAISHLLGRDLGSRLKEVHNDGPQMNEPFPSHHLALFEGDIMYIARKGKG